MGFIERNFNGKWREKEGGEGKKKKSLENPCQKKEVGRVFFNAINGSFL